jgi:predicted hydrocarbon binding protein
MKGIVFNIFEGFIVENFGDEKYDEIVESTTLTTNDPFVGPGTYPDKDLLALVETTTKSLNISDSDALKAFGKYMFPQLINRYPIFVEGIDHPKDFLLTVEDIIHVEVKKLYPDAITPTFEYQDPSKDELIIVYKSSRNLCYLMEGLLEGTKEFFKSDFQYSQTSCIHRGDSKCEFQLKF